MALVTLDEIKSWLGIELTNTTHDDTLTLIRDSVEASVLSYCDTTFALTPVVGELLDDNKSDTVITRNHPIASVQKVTIGVDNDQAGGSELDPSEYQVLPECITLKSLHGPRGRARVLVDYTYGYDGLPNDVKLAIIQATEAEFRRKGRKSVGLGGRAKKDESETFRGDLSAWDEKTGLPKEIVYKLAPYRSFEFPTQPMATRNL